MTGRLLLIGVIGFASGIVCRSLFVLPWHVTLFVVLVGLALLAIGRIKNSSLYGTVSLLLLCTALGMVRVALVPTEPPEAFAALIGSKVEFEGIVRGDPDLRETAQRITLEAEEDGACTRVLVVSTLFPEVTHGERVKVSGTLTAPEPFETDGGRVFRYDRFLAKDGVFALIEYAHVEALEEPSGLSLIRTKLFETKHLFVRGLELALPEPYASLAGGLIAGGKQGLGKELLQAFTIAGLLPIVVLSGYNVMIIAQAILRVFKFLPKRMAILAAALTITLFVLAAGTGSSAVRAGLMAGLALFARATGRTYDALRALLAVFVLMLLWNPLILVHDPGFQFSFAATLGLIIGTPLIERRLMRIRNAFLRDIVATTIAAQLFVLPLLLYQTGNLSLIAVPANVLVLPVVPLAMLFSAIAGAGALVLPPLAAIIGLPAFGLLWYIVEVAESTAALPLAQVNIPAFPFWIVLVLYALLAWGMHHLRTTSANRKILSPL